MRWVGHVALWGRGAVHTGFRCGNLRERDSLEDLDVERRALKWIFKKWDGGMDSDGLAQDKDKWRALLNAVMNLRGL
jgi:hypothetical protein